MADVSVAVEERREEAVAFTVTVTEGGSGTTHRVTVSHDDLARLSRPDEPPEQFAHRCFEFLLAREPKESILSEFDVSVIARYFPEFEREMTA